MSGKSSLLAVILDKAAAIDTVLLATGGITNAIAFTLKTRHKKKILAFRYGHVLYADMPTARRPVVIAVDKVDFGRFFRSGCRRNGRDGPVRSSRLGSDTAHKHHGKKKAKREELHLPACYPCPEYRQGFLAGNTFF